MNTLTSVARWCLSLGAKFTQVVPKRTAFIVVCTLVSQISTLLASLLPLKVIIMLGSDSVPRYFPGFLLELDRNVILALLASSAIGFFILHQLAEVAIRVFTASGSRVLLSKSHKMELFNNQQDIAESAYQRFSRALAGGVFVAIAGSAMLWFYPKMALFISAYVLLCFLYLYFAIKYNDKLKDSIQTYLPKQVSFFSSIAVFVAFAALVLDFMFFTPPSVIIAIISFLLSRQLLTRLAGFINDFYSLSLQRVRLDAIFFHGKVLLPQHNKGQQKFWEILQAEQRAEWLPALLQEFIEDVKEIESCEWHQLAANGIAAFKVSVNGKSYLVKIYDTNRTTQAKHEATLMAAEVAGLPALQWVGASQILTFHCLLYSMPEGVVVERKEFKEQSDAFRTCLLGLELPRDLVDLYTRSKPQLDQRLDSELLERMALAATTAEQLQQLSAITEALPEILSLLRRLPLTMVSGNIVYPNLWLVNDDISLLTHWGNWSLEPVGSDWPNLPAQLENMPVVLEQVRNNTKRLADISDAEIELCALLSALEQTCNRQQLTQGWELVPEIISRMELLFNKNQESENE